MNKQEKINQKYQEIMNSVIATWEIIFGIIELFRFVPKYGFAITIGNLGVCWYLLWCAKNFVFFIIVAITLARKKEPVIPKWGSLIFTFALCGIVAYFFFNSKYVIWDILKESALVFSIGYIVIFLLSSSIAPILAMSIVEVEEEIEQEKTEKDEYIDDREKLFDLVEKIEKEKEKTKKDEYINDRERLIDFLINNYSDEEKELTEDDVKEEKKEKDS